jgi:predicted metal-dependent hydrolase
MNINYEGFIILSSLLVIIYLIYNTYFSENLEKMVSTIDNREYLVQPKEDAQEAANLIAQIRAKISLLVEHLIKSNSPSDSRIIMLKNNYNPNNFKEGVDNPEYTSYSINKGEKIVLCLRNKDKLVDINTLVFVVLHEVAHIATEEIGHTDNFWANFRWILEESMNIGIYMKQEFDKKPVEYCGMTITSSPLD